MEAIAEELITQERIESEAIALAAPKVEVLVVTSADVMVEVDQEVVQLKAMERRVEDFFKPEKQEKKAAHAKVCADENRVLAILAKGKNLRLDAIQIFKDKVAAEQKRLREEAEARARKEREEAATRAKAEQEAWDRLAAAQEKERLEKIETERLAQAEKLEAEGNSQAAEAILSAPIPLAPPPAPVYLAPVFEPPVVNFIPTVSLPKTSGFTGRKNWKWRPEGGEDNRRAAVRAILLTAVKDPDRWVQFLDLNEGALNAHAKNNQDLIPVPGIQFFNQPTR